MSLKALTSASLLMAVSCGLPLPAQTPVQPSGTTTSPAQNETPLPDIPQLMREVEAHENASEAIEKTYIFRENLLQQELNGSGGLKKESHEQFDCFYLNGVFVRKLISRDGKPLTPDEEKKEESKVEAAAEKGKQRHEKAEQQGKESDSAGHEEISVARVLELGTFSNPRRLQIDGRPTILVDYTGDPHAKTRNRSETALRDLAGTISVDEQDRSLRQIQGHFLKDFKIGGGLFLDIRKDTAFEAQFTRVNQEVWLPAHLHAQGGVHALVFISFNGALDATYSNYRRFKTSATMLEGVAPVDQNGTRLPDPDPPLPYQPAPDHPVSNHSDPNPSGPARPVPVPPVQGQTAPKVP